MDSAMQFFLRLVELVPRFLMTEPIIYFVGVAFGICLVEMMKKILES